MPNSIITIGSMAFYKCKSLKSVEMSNSITSIGYSAFNSCYELESITIPSSITTLEQRLFFNCRELSSIDIPTSVTTIATEVFYGCIGLSSVEVPNSVTSLGTSVFGGCSNLISIKLPNTITTIPGSLFNGCTNLTDIEIPNTVTSIGISAFESCKSLTSVVIPNSVTEIKSKAFYSCSNLSSVSITNSVNTIGNEAFWLCSNLISIELPNTITTINDGLFYGCERLTSIDIPTSVTTIGSNAFAYSGLTSLVFPEAISRIGSTSFMDCENLKEVEIPSSVAYIGYGAFQGCSKLASINVFNGNPSNISLGSGVFTGVPTTTCALYVPKGSTGLYATADQWKDFKNIEEYKPLIKLSDGKAYTNEEDQVGINVNYTRTFIPDIWQSLYVPFNMSYDEWKNYGQVAELSCVHAYEDGRTTIEFVTVNSGELLPNVPYVFLPNTGDEITFTCTNKTLKAAPAENTKYIMCSSPRYTFKIYGNYQPISGSTLATYGDSQFNGAYVMTTDNKFQHCSPSATLKPYRFYITREKSANGYWGAPARQNAPTADNDDDDVIYFMVDGKVCGIADIVTDTDGNDAIYDLMGREVKNPSNGIYIQNGKKIRIF